MARRGNAYEGDADKKHPGAAAPNIRYVIDLHLPDIIASVDHDDIGAGRVGCKPSQLPDYQSVVNSHAYHWMPVAPG